VLSCIAVLCRRGHGHARGEEHAKRVGSGNSTENGDASPAALARW